MLPPISRAAIKVPGGVESPPGDFGLEDGALRGIAALAISDADVEHLERRIASPKGQVAMLDGRCWNPLSVLVAEAPWSAAEWAVALLFVELLQAQPGRHPR